MRKIIAFLCAAMCTMLIALSGCGETLHENLNIFEKFKVETLFQRQPQYTEIYKMTTTEGYPPQIESINKYPSTCIVYDRSKNIKQLSLRMVDGSVAEGYLVEVTDKHLTLFSYRNSSSFYVKDNTGYTEWQGERYADYSGYIIDTAITSIDKYIQEHSVCYNIDYITKFNVAG